MLVFMSNVILKLYRLFEVIVIDDDYDNDFNECDLLLMVSSYMQK